MTHHTGSVPAYERAADWRDLALCKTDPDAMYPDSSKAGIRKAKTLCDRCPARIACLVDALRAGDNQWGIRGAMKPEERQRVAAKLTTAQLEDPAAVEDAVHQVLHPHTGARTLMDLWDDHTYVMPGGHIGWRGKGNGSFSWQGHSYTPKQVAFLIDRGHAPNGSVVRTCPVVECVHPRHIADSTERRAAKKAAARAEAAV